MANDEMTQITVEQQMLEAAAKNVAAKLQAFEAGLTPDERLILGATLQSSNAETDASADDTAGYVIVGTVTLGPIAGAARRAVEVEQVRQVLERIFGFSL